MTLHDYPVNYERTLAHARKATEVTIAIESIDEIEDRWARVTACEDYSILDLKKEMLMSDIVMLLKCSVVFINKIAELEALVKHRTPSKLLRAAKKISLPLGV